MAKAELLALLQRLSDGEIGQVDVVRARALLADVPDLGLPVEDLLVDDIQGDAEALLGVLQPSGAGLGGLLAAALHAEGAPAVPDEAFADSVLQSLFADASLSISTAAREESGASPELAAAHDPAHIAVEAALQREAGPGPAVAEAFDEARLPVEEALRHEAGMFSGVDAQFDAERVPVAEAVREAARPSPELAHTFDEAAVPLVSAVKQEAGRAPDIARTFDEGVLGVAAAVSDEAGRINIVEPVAIRLDLVDEVHLTEALRDEAGHIDVAAAVMSAIGAASAHPAPVEVGVHPPQTKALPEGWVAGLLDHELPEAVHLLAAHRVAKDEQASLQLTAFASVAREVREGIASEAGLAPSLWTEIAHAIGIADPEAVTGWEPALLQAAFSEEAGTASVGDGVMEQVLAAHRHVVPDVPPEIPAPVNNASWVALTGMLVAAAMLLVFVPRMFIEPDEDEFLPAVTEFASAGEVNVDRLSYGDNASVFVELPHTTDDALIVWVDEGASE